MDSGEVVRGKAVVGNVAPPIEEFMANDEKVKDQPRDASELLRRAKQQEVTGPVCRRFFYCFRILGTMIIIGTLIADFAYCSK